MPDPVTDAMLRTLEDLIDRYGMAEICDRLSTICSEKAEHIRSNWHDETLAKAWERDAATLDKARTRVMSL